MQRDRTFNLPTGNGKRKCIDTAEKIHASDVEDLNMLDCDTNKGQGQCETECRNAGDCDGWCKAGLVYELGNFTEKCGASSSTCEFKVPGTGTNADEFMTVKNY